jgi:hypothetical protein
VIPGETILSGAPGVCPECKVKLELKVCHSGAGYYIGTICNCGPYSRESLNYYRTFDQAKRELDSGTFEAR